MTTQLRRERHSVSSLKIHLVCVTKYRRSVFTSESLSLIEISFNEVAKKMDFQVLEFNGESDHIHAIAKNFRFLNLAVARARSPLNYICIDKAR